MKLVFEKPSDVHVVCMFEDAIEEQKEKFCSHANNDLDNLIRRGVFEAKCGQVALALDTEGKGRAFVGLGKKADYEPNLVVEAFFNLANQLKEQKVSSAYLHTPKLPEEVQLESVFEGFLQSEYHFDRYLSKKKEEAPELELYVNSPDLSQEELKALFERVQNLMEGVFFTRDLVNTPANDLYPETLAEEIRKTLVPLGVEVEVLGKEAIEALGMTAFLAVSQGSEKEPRFILMKYLPRKDQKEHLSFVGKGLTYDSGGYAIKTPAGMSTMKCDMGGAGAVAGAIYAIAKNHLDVNVVGVVASCENMISGGSYKNGDIISSMKGTTIEVGNTDAEGRVTLADSIYYAATRLNSSAIIDLATLTGACVAALGNYMTGCLTSDEELYKMLEEASQKSGEDLHLFRATRHHRKQIEGTIGDLKNSAKGGAGSITAGLFLEHFTEGLPWVHMDIAGPAYTESKYSYLPAGATGIPVKTLVRFAEAYGK